MPGGRLTAREREHIAAGLAEGLGYTEIGARLGRPASTVMREVGRNGGPESYRADRAQAATRHRARRRKQARPPASPAPGGDGRDPRVVQDLAESYTALLIEQGMPRMMAKVLTCLYITDSGTLSAADLVQRLRVSPGSVSHAVAYLEQQGLLRRERAPGTRRERYVIDDGIWLRSLHASIRMNDALVTASRRGAEILGAATPAGARFASTAELLILVNEAHQAAIEEWQRRRDPKAGQGS
ncbi:GbsR/MarR family transcriptional regulator [Allonocardiopsis opalescens]|uniref:MarR family protein n=1 Tax=Allonocardiopsis opalescens TaxID=1144618 RepID=A0A2T0Q6G9_9ACTN|nr:MarR family transcriptional regulator [Allonocardiopsis opalescens]PRX99426.1 MarR family protein [Allonocardiopsis opalescens]